MNYILSGWLLGISIAIPFGPVSMMCLERSLSSGIRRGLASGAGAATTHGIYAVMAVLGANALAEALSGLKGQIQLISAIVLIVLGIRTVLRTPTSERRPLERSGGLADYVAGLTLALVNPMTLVSYLAFASSPVLGGALHGVMQALAVLGICLGTFSCYGAVSGSARILRSHLSGRTLDTLNLAAGAILVGMGILNAFR